jgi:hypothetical protein
MGKKDVGGSHFHVGASTARRNRKKDGYRRAFGLYSRFAWLFIGCCLVSVCEVVGLIPVPNGDQSYDNPGSGLRKLVFDYLKGNSLVKNNIISTYGYIQNWDTSQVTNMKFLFYNMNSGNPDISKWNTGAVTDMYASKSFTIKCCVFCLCQLMLLVCWFVGLFVSFDSILISFYLFNSLSHVHQPTLFCVCTSAFIVQCSTGIQPAIRTFQNGTRGPSPIWLEVSLSQSSVVSFVCVN